VDIPSGQSSASIPVVVIDDLITEDSETVQLTVRSISSFTQYVTGSPSSATVTITDNDGTPVEKPVVTITALDASAAEPYNDGAFTISRTGDTSSDLLVYYSTGGSATAGADYKALSGYVDIPSGQSWATIDVIVIDDSSVESSETVLLTISSNAAYSIGSPSYATVTITDDDVLEPPVVDVEQMMAKTLAFFYDSYDDGSLVSVGTWDLYRLRWTLESAYDRIVDEDYDDACVKLWDALSRCDGDKDIPDYVTGSATSTLEAMIREVIDALGC
jgi:hypothetical protein